MKSEKSISMPLKNSSKITPNVDMLVRIESMCTRLRQLLPIMMPTMISATDVGRSLMLKRARIIGVAKAAMTVIINEISMKSSFLSTFFIVSVYIDFLLNNDRFEKT